MGRTKATGTGFMDALSARLDTAEPENIHGRTAGVAVVFMARDDGMYVLFIKRADHAGDNWSGQMAFPGGKTDPDDKSFRHTAVRETREELGFDLDANARFMGYWNAGKTVAGSITVVPAVFLLNADVTISPNDEVSYFIWVPVSELVDGKNRSTYEYAKNAASPSISVGGKVIWGLTYRVISTLLDGQGAA